MSKNAIFISNFKKIVLFLYTICFCGVALAETVNWYVDDNIYTTTTCEIGNDITLPATPQKKGYTFTGWRERTNRGTFPTWANIPINDISYLPNSQGTRTPLNGDYIIVQDTSDVPDSMYIVSYMGYGYWWSNSRIDFTIDGTKYTINVLPAETETFITSVLKWKTDGTNTYITSIYDAQLPSGAIITSGNTIKTISNGAYYPGGKFNLLKDIGNYHGAWQFVYDGDWTTDGKAGWKPVTRIE